MSQVRLEVLGTGSYLPSRVITNDFFINEEFCKYDVYGNIIETKELIAEKIFETTGILERRKSDHDEWPSDMGYKASVKAIEYAGVSVDSLVGIIVTSVTEGSNFPSAACKIQKKLGVRDCLAYDIQNACAGFPEALAQANSRVLQREGNYLVIASECLTKITDYFDINSTLFGDGAGAAVLRPTDGKKGILAEYSMSDPFEGKDRWIFRDTRGYLRMPEGGAVMKEAVRSMLECARSLKEKAGWDKADVYIPHQANGRILSQVEKRVIDDGAVVYKNIEKYGNMSAATCAVALDECLRKNIIKDKSRVIITSFGAGLVTAGVALQF